MSAAAAANNAPQVVSTTAAPTTEYLQEVPSSLKQLARLVVRGFYGMEDALIIDMLVRHPCMREDDVAGLLKFDKKMLRARMTILKNDKFLQAKQRIETDEEGKVVKMNCYYINYRTFVNVVKYKLDHMRKKMETSERDQTSRSSFKCLKCNKNFTDLEANQLIDFMTGEMRCTHCSGIVDEDESSGPQKDSRKMLAKFNLEMKPLYELLHLVEAVNLAPDLLEPEPVDVDLLTGRKSSAKDGAGGVLGEGGGPGGKWSGEASRGGGMMMDTQKVEIKIGDEAENPDKGKVKHAVPDWILRSAIQAPPEAANNEDSNLSGGAGNEPQMPFEPMDDEPESTSLGAGGASGNADDEISQMLLRHERKAGDGNKAVIPGDSDSDNKSDDSDMDDVTGMDANSSRKQPMTSHNEGGKVSSSEEDEEGGAGGGGGSSGVPTVRVGGQSYVITEIDADVIAKMTEDEQEKYTQAYQEFYADMYD